MLLFFYEFEKKRQRTTITTTTIIQFNCLLQLFLFFFYDTFLSTVNGPRKNQNKIHKQTLPLWPDNKKKTFCNKKKKETKILNCYKHILKTTTKINK